MTLDTNILVAYLDGEPPVIDVIHTLFQQGSILLVPAVSTY